MNGIDAETLAKLQEIVDQLSNDDEEEGDDHVCTWTSETNLMEIAKRAYLIGKQHSTDAAGER